MGEGLGLRGKGEGSGLKREGSGVYFEEGMVRGEGV